MQKSFLQTNEWLEFQKSIGRKAWRFDNGKIVANIIQHDLPFGMNYLYIPHGPEIRFEDISGGLRNELEQFISHVKNIAKEEKSIFIKVEPLLDSVIELIYGAGFKKSAKEIQAHKSVVLDLGTSEEELLGIMHHKTRHNIKVAEKHNVSVEPSTDVNEFWELLKKTMKRQKFSSHTKNYHKKLFEFFNKEGEIKSELFIARHEGKPVAGALMLTYGDTYYYLHGGSDNDYRNVMAPYALHWYLIKQANQKGLKHYDFGGSETVKWPGITRFKLSWGGRQVEYPGAFDMSIRSFWFMAYKILRKIF
mgnify:CR=1 FL=1